MCIFIKVGNCNKLTFTQVSCHTCKRQFHASCVSVASSDSRYVCSACKLAKAPTSRAGAKKAKTVASKATANDARKLLSFV